MEISSKRNVPGPFVWSLVCMAALAGAARAEDARIIAGIRSSQQVVDDLEYLVVTLAQKKQSWEENVYPNLEIFLIGVSEVEPVRFDMLFSPQHGQQLQPYIPVSNLNEFIQDNLEPIDIIPKRTRQDRDLYEITGTVMEGWMRFLANPIPAVVFYPQQEAIPKGMTHPSGQHARLIENGELVFLHLTNDAEGQDDRKASWGIYRDKALEELQKFPDESRDAYELRKRMRMQSLDVFEQLLVETGEAKWWLKLDQAASTAPSELRFSALPETALAETVARVRSEPGRFSQHPVPEEALFVLRGNLPIDKARSLTYREIYELARPVLNEEIDAEEKATAEEKAARKEAAALLLDILGETAELAVIDGFLDVVPANGKHAVVLGIRCLGQEKIQQIIDKLPAVSAGWTVTRDVDQAGETAIHQLNLGEDLPASLREFFGDSGNLFLATSELGFWLSGGEQSLDLLKTRMQESRPADDASDGVLLSLNMHVQPMLKLMHEYSTESDLAIIKSLKERRSQIRDARKDEGEEEAERPGQRAASNLANFEWEEAAIASLEGQDDRVELLMICQEDGSLIGTGNVYQGMLKAIGVLVAKFSDENLK